VAHCPPELLDDLAGVFAEIRPWPGVVEKSRGVFYVRREPFLHFHRTSDGGRRADVKGESGWISLRLPRPLSTARQRRLLRMLRSHYGRAAAAPLSTRAARRP
jgi:hypothetical protein